MEKRILFLAKREPYGPKNPLLAVPWSAICDYYIQSERIHSDEEVKAEEKLRIATLRQQVASQGIIVSPQIVQSWGLTSNDVVYFHDGRLHSVSRFAFQALGWASKRSGRVLIPAEYLRSAPKEINAIFQKCPQISEEDWKQWNIRQGSQVQYFINAAGKVQIIAVNGHTTPWAKLDFFTDILGDLDLAHPVSEIDIASNNNLTTRIIRAKSPIGKGGANLVLGPAESGKTWTARAILDGMLISAQENVTLRSDNAVFVCLSVGERPGDVRKLRATLAKYPDLNWQLFTGFNAETVALNAELALGVVRELLAEEKDVIFAIDSAWGLVMMLGEIIAGEGLAGAGVSRPALNYVKSNFIHAGSIPGGGSITTLITSLDEGERSSSGAVAHEIGKPTATTLIVHYRDTQPGARRPWIMIGETRSREIDDMLGHDTRRRLHDDLAIHTVRAADGKERFAVQKAQLDYLQTFFTATPFEEEAIHTAWQKEDAESAQREVQEAYRIIAIEAGAKLRSVPNKATATFAMWRTAGVPLPEEVLAQLFAGLQPEARQRALALIQQKAGTILPADQLLQAAQVLQGNEDVIPTFLKALRMAGIEPQELIHASSGDPVEAMLAVSEKLVSEGGKSFSRKVAEKLVESGNTPEKVYDFLKAGGTPSKLYGSNGSS